MDLFLDYLDPLMLDSVYESTRQRIELNSCSALYPIYSSVPGNVTYTWNERLCTLATNAEVWERDGVYRQIISIFVLNLFLSIFFYFFFGVICYYIHFDRALKNDPKFRHNQIAAEISDSLTALFWGNALIVPILLAQIRGYSKLYKFGEASWIYEVAQYPLFLLFNDTGVYWLHRLFHVPVLFKATHKKHHQYVVPTPFSAYAFDPLEAWIMSLPIFAYAFILPMSDMAQLIGIFASHIWTFLLHDNRDQFHTVHHKSVNYNFGQYLYLWDQLGGTFLDPGAYFQPKKSLTPCGDGASKLKESGKA